MGIKTKNKKKRRLQNQIQSDDTLKRNDPQPAARSGDTQSNGDPLQRKKSKKRKLAGHNEEQLQSAADKTNMPSPLKKKHKRVKKKVKRRHKASPTLTKKKEEKPALDNQETLCRADESAPTYAFDVNAADHCETPLEAYRDLLPVLDDVAKRFGKTRETLKIYDPYYCEGAVKQHLRSLGFAKVSNRNQDCYAHWATKKYDVMITNPPYSGDHVVRLAQYIASQPEKPFCLLLPNYFYTKHDVLLALQKSLNELRFLVPPSRYLYDPPRSSADALGAKRNRKTSKTAPFVSLWFLINVEGQHGVSSRQLPDQFKPSEDKTRRKKQKSQGGPRFNKNGERLCDECGQIFGNCRHSKT
eukprot:GEMP01041534.1.p1 GENE.GEMP01041534.1~~GEMP01041534.1.p1  ORF type:complete len:357 (+),score=86.82 GEMP01041534.1:87-1157(+)